MSVADRLEVKVNSCYNKGTDLRNVKDLMSDKSLMNIAIILDNDD